ncbi:hypothetical protein MMC06_000861 [Schaereria dolodes]|nr:hypothetical protein [Schaereria dolodes]
MSETCIVCLGDLGESAFELPRPLIQAIKVEDDDDGGSYADITASTSHLNNTESELIAHLLPCGHNLHDDCLKPWVERANSCPICRQSFNQVELSIRVGAALGPVVSSYAVDDRTQVADVDPSMLIEELDDEPESQPCPMCGDDDNEDVLLLCDGCDMAYHTYCIDLDSVPAGHWFCETCIIQRAIDSVSPHRNRAQPHHSPACRTRGQERLLRNRNQVTSSNWARVWQSVWDRLNIDLDFPFDDRASAAQITRSRRMTANHRRDFREWERRFQVAERQGGTNRFRETAPALLDLPTSRERPEPPEPESQEEILAWNALEKAKEIQADPAPNKRKRKSATTSPTDVEPALAIARRHKRPQTRRTLDLADIPSETAPEASNSRRRSRGTSASGSLQTSENVIAGNGPSFLQSLLREVESSAAPDESKGQHRPSALLNIVPTDHSSPRLSSPGASPTASNHPSPRPISTTPPPSLLTRPGSPIPLTSKVEPIYPLPEFSPSRSPPLESALQHHQAVVSLPLILDRRRSRALAQSSPASSPTRSEDTSPSRINMSLSAKSDVQKMVKDALRPHYHSNNVSKDQYTNINRSVSRMLYDKVGDSGNLNSDAKETWERMASEEVAKAVRLLRSSAYA